MLANDGVGDGDEPDDNTAGQFDIPNTEPGPPVGAVPARTSRAGSSHPSRPGTPAPNGTPTRPEEPDDTAALYALIEQSYSGPIPLPDHLKQYNELVPGSAERIIDAVYQAPSRRQDEIVKAQIETSRVGQRWAIFLAVIFVAASITFFFLGNNYAGSAFLTLPLVQFIAAFLPFKH